MNERYNTKVISKFYKFTISVHSHRGRTIVATVGTTVVATVSATCPAHTAGLTSAKCAADVDENGDDSWALVLRESQVAPGHVASPMPVARLGDLPSERRQVGAPRDVRWSPTIAPPERR